MYAQLIHVLNQTTFVPYTTVMIIMFVLGQKQICITALKSLAKVMMNASKHCRTDTRVVQKTFVKKILHVSMTLTANL